jgi:hypothetical protein
VQPNHPFALIGERVLMPCPAGLVVPAVVGGQPIGAAVVHVCEGKGMIFADPRRLATPNIGYTEEESKEPAPSRPRLVTPN